MAEAAESGGLKDGGGISYFLVVYVCERESGCVGALVRTRTRRFLTYFPRGTSFKFDLGLEVRIRLCY